MIAKKCIHIVFAPLLFSIIFLILKFYIVSSFLTILFIFFLFFFRDPYREIGDGIVSPADGIVMESGKKVAIFMNLWDVHVNRAPLSGKIIEMKHTPGKHSPAFMEKGENEHLSIKMETEIGMVKVVQIAGIIARRIVPYIQEGDEIKKGDKIGIVRFGSKVEIYLPDEAKVTIKKGDRIKAGQTIGICR